MGDSHGASARRPWPEALVVGALALVAHACGGSASTDSADPGGASSSGGAGGVGASAVGGAGLGPGGAAGSGGCGIPPSACPTPSAACCAALDPSACLVPGDECRLVGFTAYEGDVCNGPGMSKQECFVVDPDLYIFPEELDDCGNPQTGTGVGVNTAMYRVVPDGSTEVGSFAYQTCGVDSWHSCAEPDAPPACGCSGAADYGCTWSGPE